MHFALEEYPPMTKTPKLLSRRKYISVIIFMDTFICMSFIKSIENHAKSAASCYISLWNWENKISKLRMSPGACERN